MTHRTKARIVPVLKKTKGHEGHVDGYIVHPDDRVVRDVPIRKPAAARKQSAKDLL